jgi:hypothetical protein
MIFQGTLGVVHPQAQGIDLYEMDLQRLEYQLTLSTPISSYQPFGVGDGIADGLSHSDTTVQRTCYLILTSRIRGEEIPSNLFNGE